MLEVQPNRSGRKPKWRAGATDLIRVPKSFREQILEYTQQLDLGNVPPPPTVQEVQQRQLTQIDKDEILIYLKENFNQFVPSRDTLEQLAQSQLKVRAQAARIATLEAEQKQLLAFKSEAESLRVELRTKDRQISSLTRQRDRVVAEVETLRQQKANLLAYSSTASDSDRRITKILKLLQQVSTGTGKIYVEAIFQLVAGVSIQRIDLCVSIMGRLSETDKTHNNCCRDAAWAAIEGSFQSIESAMAWVNREYDERKEKNSRKD